MVQRHGCESSVSCDSFNIFFLFFFLVGNRICCREHQREVVHIKPVLLSLLI